MEAFGTRIVAKPTDAGPATVAHFADPYGNLIQIAQARTTEVRDLDLNGLEKRVDLRRRGHRALCARDRACG